ncbi:hypothetical protein [Candidatus Nardonella dryophthoridicola]|uniref:hypothetical protein n=1 Tax=Candidatus Nardonella dryophthoridicola TaxID=1971485 RepID=UPI001AD850B6|nr:hypothetical protein [Candidatus Nardonella dryophthoridicola]QTJ62963.1 hypothetical protein JRY34_00480 [Candidatus Nardonella dryophthoridicola]
MIYFVIFILSNIYYFFYIIINDKILAFVNDKIILKSDLLNYVRYNRLYNDLYKNYNYDLSNLNNLVKDIIIYNISRKKIKIDNKIINKIISIKAKKNFLSKKDYIEYILDNNINKKFYKLYIKRKIYNHIFINKYIKNKIFINDKEIDYYKNYFNISDNFIKNLYCKMNLYILKINSIKINNKIIDKISKIFFYNKNNLVKLQNNILLKKSNNINFIKYNEINFKNIPIFIRKKINLLKSEKIEFKKKIIINNNIFLIRICKVKKPNIDSIVYVKRFNCFYINNKNTINNKKEIFNLFNYLSINNKKNNLNFIKKKFKNVNFIKKYYFVKKNINYQLLKEIRKINCKNILSNPILINNRWILLKLYNIESMKLIDFYKEKIISNILYNRKINFYINFIIKKNKNMFKIYKNVN